MKQMIKITDEEFCKIYGSRKHPQIKVAEGIQPLFPDVNILYEVFEEKRKEIREKASFGAPEDANAYIVGPDQNKDNYFNTTFGVQLAHKYKQEITYVTMVPGSYCNVNLSKSISKEKKPIKRKKSFKERLLKKIGLSVTVSGLLFAGTFLFSENTIKQKSLERSFGLSNITGAKMYNLEKDNIPIKRVYIDEKPYGSLDYVLTLQRDRNGKSHPFHISTPSKEDVNHFNQLRIEEYENAK